MSGDPQRLFEASDADPQLRLDLQRARETDPAGYDVVAGLAAFEASIAGVPEGVSQAEIGAAAGTSKSVTWIVAAIVGAAAAGAIAWAVSRDAGEREVVLGDAQEIAAPDAEVDAEVVAAEADAHDRDAEPEPEPALVLEAEPEPAPEPEAAPEEEDLRAPEATTKTRSRSRPKPARPEPTEPTPDRLAAEMKATNAAKHRLDTDPAQALRLAQQADRDFPGGLFQQERQAIAVLALFRLGRTPQAKAKAKAYLARHPRGSFADRIREALQSEPSEG